MKSPLSYALLIFIFTACSVQGQTGNCYWIKDMPAHMSAGQGPVFQTTDNGITISASFLTTATNLDSIELTLRLINRSGSDLIIKDFGYLEGFNFHLENLFHKEMSRTPYLKEALAIPPPPPAPVMGGLTGFTLKTGGVSEEILPLTKYILIPKLGEYRLRVDWRQLEKPDGDGRWWRVPDNPRMQLTGTILLQQTAKGISISAVK
jgi:hypothetical protein